MLGGRHFPRGGCVVPFFLHRRCWQGHMLEIQIWGRGPQRVQLALCVMRWYWRAPIRESPIDYRPATAGGSARPKRAVDFVCLRRPCQEVGLSIFVLYCLKRAARPLNMGFLSRLSIEKRQFLNTLPVNAEEPKEAGRSPPGGGAYLRTRGGTPPSPSAAPGVVGLSPHTRRNLARTNYTCFLSGPISAHAEEPGGFA